MTVLSSPVADERHWQQTLRTSVLFQFSLTAMVAGLLLASRSTSLAAGYFFDQDVYMLVAGGLVLAAMRWMPMTGAPVGALSRERLLALTVLAALVAYACTFLIFHHYAISRDEQSAEFSVTYLAAGHLGWAIPDGLRDLGRAMMPMHTTVRPASWTSNYLPIAAALRVPMAWLGDQWLGGPVLLIVGTVALAGCARRIWPDRPRAATVAVVMALTSTQVIVNAATPFAMTGHYALGALWLYCFIRGDRSGHLAAATIGVLASGLHQAHFHITFLLCVILWLVIERRFRLAAFYTIACLFYWFLWRYAYPMLLETQLGAPISWPPAIGQRVNAGFSRLLELQPGESLTRFIAWQNLLLLPLSLAGATAARCAHGAPRILQACAIACFAGLATMVLQDHGFGYRYLHHLIPCFCLLAAGGWLALEERLHRPLPAMFLTTSVVFAVCITLPVAAWRTMVAAAPYEAAYRAVRGADADYVLVDTRAGAYLQDIVRVEKDRHGPVLLDLGYVPAGAIDRLCGHSRIMVFGDAQARYFGVPVDADLVANYRETAARAAQLTRLHCGRPLPTT